MRLNVPRASSSVIRMIWLRLKVRASRLSKKCCDKGPILVSRIVRRGQLSICSFERGISSSCFFRGGLRQVRT
jgi:hypothetical protein